VGFEEGEAVAEVGSGSVEGCSREITHLGDGTTEYPADLALEGVELGIVEEAEEEGEALPNEESSDDSYFAGQCEWGGGHGIDEGCGCAL
jgi:hypothetical protein